MSSGCLSADDANSTDGEGVWSPDIEQAFQEALLIYLPCGRRKHIIQEEGNASKMYGRNELIARHIKLRTGKTRSRKQVSSHIQVLARRKAKLEPNNQLSHNINYNNNNNNNSNGNNNNINNNNNHHNHNHNHLHQQQQHNISIDSLNNNDLSHHFLHRQHNQMRASTSGTPSSSIGSSSSRPHSSERQVVLNGLVDDSMEHIPLANYYDTMWMDRPIVTQRIRLVEFSAFIEQRNPTNISAIPQLITPLAQATTTTCPTLIGQQHDLPTSAHQHSITSQHLYQQTQQPHLNQIHSPQELNSKYTNSLTQPVHSHHQQHQTAATHLLIHPQQQPKQEVVDIMDDTLQLQHTTASISNQSLTSPIPKFTRHSYVKIDYTHSLDRQTKHLEPIDIGQIQDKFPEIGGPYGLFQRGPTDAFFLVKFWADLNNDFDYNMDDQNSYFAFSSHFETLDPYKDITCSTKACSYGLQVVEKVDKIRPTFNTTNRCYSYAINRSPMCEFMIKFIKRLRQLPRASQMNSVLENFSVLQVVTSDSTSEILLCIAYVFEVAAHSLSHPLDTHLGPQYNVYKLTKD